MAEEKYLSPAELSARWGGKVKPKTLSNWRGAGEGPPFQKLGGRIAYTVSDVEEYERKRKFNSRADYSGKKEEAA